LGHFGRSPSVSGRDAPNLCDGFVFYSGWFLHSTICFLVVSLDVSGDQIIQGSQKTDSIKSPLLICVPKIQSEKKIEE
jgi:hypothetical protein